MAADTERSPASDPDSATEGRVQERPSGDLARKSSLEEVPKPMHEESPLLSPVRGSSESDADYNGSPLDDDYHDEFEDVKGLGYMILLTISLVGLQLAWSVEFSNGTPYLLSLGISKSIMALVWMAGPLSGALVQPYIGILSDNCRSPWGKRRPFMAIGTIATVVALVGLAWAREWVGGILSLFGADPASNGVKNTVIVVAVLLVYVLDFSINTVQAAIRAFVLDCCPSHQQEAANSMASRAVGVGNILGYIAGYINLRRHLSLFGNTQFKILCVIASVALSGTVLLSSFTIKERDPRLEGPPSQKEGGIISFFGTLLSSIRRLPPQTRKACEVQFFAWIGFFPQLFYSSSYVGDIYVQSFLEENPNMSDTEIDHLYEKATRIGTFALLMYAIVSLATNLFLPFFIAPSYDAASGSKSIHSQKSYTTCLSRVLDSLVIPWLTLRRAWLCAHLIFAACMFSTLVVRSVWAATLLIAFVGIPWALTLWAPFAIISAEVSKRDALMRVNKLGGKGDEAEVDQAGVILGIHNMAIATPQILATLGSSFAFKFFQKPRGTPGDHSFSYVLAAGGVFALVAAWLTSRIQDEVPVTEDGALENGGTSGMEREGLIRRGSFSYGEGVN